MSDMYDADEFFSPDDRIIDRQAVTISRLKHELKKAHLRLFVAEKVLKEIAGEDYCGNRSAASQKAHSYLTHLGTASSAPAAKERK